MSRLSGFHSPNWRVYAAFWGFLAAVAILIHLVAHVSIGAAALFALAGSLANGLLILLGDICRHPNSGDAGRSADTPSDK